MKREEPDGRGEICEREGKLKTRRARKGSDGVQNRQQIMTDCRARVWLSVRVSVCLSARRGPALAV